MRPLIGIIDWAKSPLAEPECEIERAVIAEAAQVRRFPCDGDADFPDALCRAEAVIVWHNTSVTTANRGLGRGGGRTA